ncbi:MAG: phosphoglucosamine mutase, partial [Raoultibacter sp.]
TCLTPLRELVEQTGADIGIAHDGDADRVMFVDASGAELDGDVVEAVCAIDLASRNMLPGNAVVSTVMCNLGFTHAMRDAGIEVHQTQVGDRYVLETMREQGLALGGEQSGHMIFLEHNSTGDGLVTALQFLAACQRTGKTVAEAASVMQRFPQVLINVRVGDKHALEGNKAIWDSVSEAETALGEDGRILVRTSGTEPLVRVMVEAADHDTAQRFAEAVAKVVEAEL